MWIENFCIEYILWRIVKTKSMFDVANMLNKILSKMCQRIIWASKHTSLFISYFMEQGLHPISRDKSWKYWVVPLISTTVSCHSRHIINTTPFHLHFCARYPMLSDLTAADTGSGSETDGLASVFWQIIMVCIKIMLKMELFPQSIDSQLFCRIWK